MVLEVITIDLRRGLMRIVGTVWVGVLWACQQCSFGQDSLSWELDLQGYLEPYFAYDLGMPANGERPRFLYNHKRHNETSLNLAMVQMEASRDASGECWAPWQVTMFTITWPANLPN